ncbi:unnamed protein product [Dovyalis caffra]|uniref:RING-type domain-containing protein n=1 Tax=Dovyalis caffra TaxID=77055 RepID=A0AAV1QTT5_9ROSI|nr:unnamed protein product [Dovyalis caffra]
MGSSTAYGTSPGHSISMAFGVLILIIILTLVAYFWPCGVQESSTQTTTDQGNSITDRHSTVIELGLDEATLASYPKLLYSKAKLGHKDNDLQSPCCSICLGDYKDSDMLRLLPDCGHVFHLNCVDCWLRLHPTCPICRKLPMPTPLSTPLVEVAALGARR